VVPRKTGECLIAPPEAPSSREHSVPDSVQPSDLPDRLLDAPSPRAVQLVGGQPQDLHLSQPRGARATGEPPHCSGPHILLVDVIDARAEAARRKIADCDQPLANNRATLDCMESADTAIVASWIAQIQVERLGAEAELAACAPEAPLSSDALREALGELGSMAQVLADADPAEKAALYRELGISITYDPRSRTAWAESLPAVACATARVGGGTATITPPAWETSWVA
jgi:hypothetical protein